MNCTYNKPWIGKCNVSCEVDYCEEHQKEKCCVCGSQATHGCDNTQFLVCGAPLCDNKLCDTIHEVTSHGWNLKEFMNWTGRKHTDDEIIYINELIQKRKVKLERLSEQYKQIKA